MGQGVPAEGNDLLGGGLVKAFLQFNEGAWRLPPFFIRLGDDGGSQHGRVLVKRAFDLDGGNILTTGNDDVLGAVLELDIAVRVEHAQVAGMEPAAGEGFVRCRRVLQVALHDDVALEHDLADGLAVGGYRGHGFWVNDAEPFQHRVAYPLAGFHLCLFLNRQFVPGGVPFADGGRAVSLGQAIGVRYPEAHLLHGFQGGGGGWCGGRHDVDGVVEIAAFPLGGIDQEVHDDRGAAEICHFMVGDGVKHGPGLDLAQADVGTGQGRHRPCIAPAVAMEHGQGPQIDRLFGHAPGENIADGVEVGPPVVVDDALRVAGGTRRIVERDRRPFVIGQRPVEIRVAPRNEGLIVQGAERLATGVGLAVVDVDDQDIPAIGLQGAFDGGGKFQVGDQRLGFGMAQDKADGFRVEPRVDGVDNRAHHGNAEGSFIDFRRVRRDHSYRVAGLDAGLDQGRSQPPAALIGLRPGVAALAVDNRRMAGIDGCRPLDKSQRRQRRVIGGIGVEVGLVGAPGRHAIFPWYLLFSRLLNRRLGPGSMPKTDMTIPDRNAALQKKKICRRIWSTANRRKNPVKEK